MTFLEELINIITGLGLPVETGVFSGQAPPEYVVITPLADTFALHADNRPQHETQEARLSLFAQGNYLRRKNELVKALLSAVFTITDRKFVGYEPDTLLYHYSIDCAKPFELGE